MLNESCTLNNGQDSIGLIGASGTGMQEISCLIDRYGGGISHAIGVGGRDLNSTVGGISTLMALDALDADTMTESIVLVSKPPPKDVATRVLERIGQYRWQVQSLRHTRFHLGLNRLEIRP